MPICLQIDFAESSSSFESVLEVGSNKDAYEAALDLHQFVDHGG